MTAPVDPIRWRDAWMMCRDGTRLISRIWSPPGEGPWPTLLMRQPYGRAIASTVVYAHPRWYASQGFLVVVQDVRGRGDSEGHFGGFAQEAADGSDCLHWLRQLPECNGRVGCYGFSYQGLTQLTWETPGPLPDCLAPAMAGLDERLHWASSGGAHWWALGLGWGLQLAAQECQRRGDVAGWRELRRSLDNGSYLEEGTELLQRHAPDGMALEWLRHDAARSDGWRRHTPSSALLQRPMLLIGGWHDPHLEGVLELWQRSRGAGGDPWIRIGAWGHLGWGGALDELQLAFFRRHLQDNAGEPLLECRAAVQNSRGGPWQPLLRPQAEAHTTWRLSATGTLQAGEVHRPDDPRPGRSDAGWITCVHDPWRPVPGRGGHLGLDAGLCERGDLDARQDVICFTGPEQTKPLPLQGRPVLELLAYADQPGFDLAVALAAVRPDGEVLQLCTGVGRWLGERCQQNAMRRVVLQPLWTELRPGERLRLSLAGAAWPQIAINPGDGEPPWGGSGCRHRIISLSLGMAGARLTLEPLTIAAARADWTETNTPS